MRKVRKGSQFELYQGNGTRARQNIKALEGSVVMRFSDTILRNQNIKLVFDNYFNSMGLIRPVKEAGYITFSGFRFKLRRMTL